MNNLFSPLKAIDSSSQAIVNMALFASHLYNKAVKNRSIAERNNDAFSLRFFDRQCDHYNTMFNGFMGKLSNAQQNAIDNHIEFQVHLS